jgi:hypothetical protein
MMGDKSRKIPDMYSTSSHASMGYHYSQKSCSNTVVELGEKDFSAGLTFVAISCIKTLKGLAFHTHFNHAQLKKIKRD